MQKIHGIHRLGYFSDFSKIFQIITCVILGVIAAKIVIGMKPLFIIAAGVGMIVLIVTFFKPELGIIAVLIITSSVIFEKALPLIPVAVGSLHAPDVLLLFLLCMIPFKALTDRNFKLFKTPLDKPLMLFYLAALISAYISVAKFHNDFNIAMRSLRPITYYLIFFPIVNLIRNKKQLISLIRGLSFIAILIAVTMIIQAIVGESIQLMPGRIETLQTLGEMYYGTTRIIPPGDVLIYVMFITFICIAVLTKTTMYKNSNFLKIGFMGVSLILMFGRHYWLTAIFALAVFTLLISQRYKMRIIALILAAILVLVILTPISIKTEGRIGGFVSSAINRVTSLFSGERMFRSATLDARRFENRYAINQIKEHPIHGIGIGSRYIPGQRWLGDTGTYIHNSYLWIFMKMGGIGLIPFIWLSITVLLRGFSKWGNIEDSFLKAVAIGFTLSYLGLMISNIIAPKFMEGQAITVIGAIIGINEAIYRIENKNRKSVVAK